MTMIPNTNDDEIAEHNLFSKVGKKNPFTTPDQYFESFSENISIRISQEKPVKKSRVVSLFKPVFAIAAALIIGFFVYYIVQLNRPKGMSEGDLRVALAKVDKNELENFLYNNIDEVNEDLLLDNTKSNNIYIYKKNSPLDEKEKKELLNEFIESDNSESIL